MKIDNNKGLFMIYNEYPLKDSINIYII